jgi:hypothetical protein
MTQQTFKRVLGIDPFSSGVGFAVLEGPNELIDWGTRSTRIANSEKAVLVIEKLIDRYEPDLLAIENWESEGARRRPRIEALLDRIVVDERKRLPVRLIAPNEIRRVGSVPRSGTKHGRATLLAERFPELAPFLPRPRKIWDSEDSRMSIFDAAAFAIACFPAKKDTPGGTDEPTGQPDMENRHQASGEMPAGM